MVEIIPCPSAKGVDIQNPSFIRNGHTELRFFVALSMEGNKSQILRVHKLQQRSRGGLQRRRLIKMSIEAAKHPVYFWHLNGDSKTRAGGIFYNISGKMALADTRI